MRKGLVHIYTGDGKGKTTAALGLATRCAGHGNKVRIYQFLKATPTGELSSLKKLGIDIIRVNSSEKFYPDMNDDEKKLTCKEITKAVKSLFSDPCDMLVADEIICAADLGIINAETIIDLIKSKPFDTELVMTGRNMPDALLEYADYVSEIKCIKHPYNKGVGARYGIDF